MKVSESWLRSWVNPSITGEELTAQLTMAGLEIDSYNPVAGKFSQVVVAHVLNARSHPQADKLSLCEVSTGTGEFRQVVCGANNVRAGLKVALALPGAHLPGGMFIKEAKLRGELSQGMLCSAAELGMEEHSEGIMELAEDAPIGCDLREYLLLDDCILEVDLTPNRADCFSVLGIGREIAALNRLPLNTLSLEPVQPQLDESLSVRLEAPHACPQYCGRIIRGINPHAETPLWMKERLRRSGIRPLNAAVDVTNYVMLELGQPMHAFDLQSISGNIQVRLGKARETLTLLNGDQVELDETVLVIADENQALAIAGIMGGEGSCVNDKTSDVFLESAFFNPLSIAGVGRRYGLMSDSSQRFERGVDPGLQVIALERATGLLLSIAGGKSGPVTLVNEPQELPQQININFAPQRVKQLTGVEVPEDEMMAILKRLGMKVSRQEEHWLVVVPSYRFDVRLEVDLIEEIIRLYGYHNIKIQDSADAISAGKINVSESLMMDAANFFMSRGYHETITYSFVDPELQSAIYPEANHLSLLNPISQELSQMRVGMWPGLIASMIYNIHRQQSALKLFEMGVIFDTVEGDTRERSVFAGLLTGESGHLNWAETARPFDFFDAKGDLQAFFATHSVAVEFVLAQHPALHPGQSARMLLGEQEIGWIGVLHPRLQDAFDLDKSVILFEMLLEPFASTPPVRFQPVSKYPHIRRDLSFLVAEDVSAAHIEEEVRCTVDAVLLKSLTVFDVYMGAGIPEGKKSLAIALTLQDPTKTLVDAEINTIIDAIIKKLILRFAITLRD